MSITNVRRPAAARTCPRAPAPHQPVGGPEPAVRRLARSRSSAAAARLISSAEETDEVVERLNATVRDLGAGAARTDDLVVTDHWADTLAHSRTQTAASA